MMINLLKRVISRIERGDWGTAKWKRSFRHFGEGSVIAYPGILQNPGNISIGEKTTIHSNSRIQCFRQCDKNSSIIIGDRCFIGYFFTILNASSVSLGNDVLIASHVLISSENHGINPESDIQYMDQPLVTKPVSIGDGCWIGEKVCILPGVSIGKKSIIGAGSVVTKSIPDYCIAAGNPAKVIKKYNFETHKWECVRL